MLADLLEAYTASVRKKDGAMADIAALPTQREMLVSLAGDRAIKAGIQHYKDTMCTIDGNVMGKERTCLLENTGIFWYVVGVVIAVLREGASLPPLSSSSTRSGSTLLRI